ncbi:hypothetical protein [Streptomyces sp. WAC06614]|uniref:hypothetical protein n=1 Tax=Streptomyces sp. WAC06614 TaxID=2487416 RepID=UPI000F776527|nr:hypothetical protein [Streptomyces sp. WAC06614]RSS78275.1 hypothetical protein EF918_21580 [Streptomyces sp. WAC06614]
MSTAFDDVRRHVAAGDIPSAVRTLRPLADTAELADLVAEVGPLAEAVGFRELAKAAEKAARKPGDPRRLYAFGYLCIEHGIAFAAVPALREALRLTPGPAGRRPLSELVAALEAEDRHGEATQELLRHEALLEPWPGQYLVACNALLSGDLATARERAARLPAPDDDAWTWAHARLRRMLDRAEAAARTSPLDATDLRGWQFVLTGTLLGSLSPYGFQVMRGRYAYLSDSYEACRRSLDRLAVALDAAGHRPDAVSALPGRSDRILALAAAEILALDLVPYAPQRPDTLVVAYDLGDHDPEVQDGLRDRAPGQVLYEHATRWTETDTVPADFSGLHRQVGAEPWGARLTAHGPGEPDTRPEEAIARDIVAAGAHPADPGDGSAPADADTDAAFRAFATAVAPLWRTGPRAPIRSSGPVRSNSF